MSEHQKKLLQIAYGMALSVLAALVTMMLSTEKSVWTKVRTFIAGVSCGVLVHLILMNFSLGQGWKDIFSTASAAFVATIWPTLGTIYRKFIEHQSKKFNIQDNDKSRNGGDSI